MAFFTYGSAGLGAHSDLETRGDSFRQRRVKFRAHEEFPHGPVKVLMEAGKVLRPPKVLTVRSPQNL